MRISAPQFFHRFVFFCRWVCHSCPDWLHRMQLWLAQPVISIIVAFRTLCVVIWHQFRGYLLVEWYVSSYPMIPSLGCDHCILNTFYSVREWPVIRCQFAVFGCFIRAASLVSTLVMKHLSGCLRKLSCGILCFLSLLHTAASFERISKRISGLSPVVACGVAL